MCWREERGLPRCGVDMPSIIKLPDIRQNLDFDCGHACLRVCWDHFGIKSRPVPSTPLDGTSPDTLEAILWQSGLHVQSGKMDMNDLQYHTKRGRPVVCLVTEAEATGHWVVVGGVAWRQVHYQCPLVGAKKEPIESFKTRWNDATRRGVIYTSWGIAVSQD